MFDRFLKWGGGRVGRGQPPTPNPSHLFQFLYWRRRSSRSSSSVLFCILLKRRWNRDMTLHPASLHVVPIRSQSAPTTTSRHVWSEEVVVSGRFFSWKIRVTELKASWVFRHDSRVHVGRTPSLRNLVIQLFSHPFPTTLTLHIHICTLMAVHSSKISQ